MRVRFFKDKSGQFRFRIQSDNNEILATSEAYTRRVDAKRGFQDLLDSLSETRETVSETSGGEEVEISGGGSD